jgi:hypothetical protein
MKRAVILCGFLLVALMAALGPPGRETEAQASCFPETGFCVTNPSFMEYFRLRGGVRIMGYPVSRSFTLDGFEVQIFQRVVLQLQGSVVQRLNVLDPNVMPMTRANQSIFPAPDPALAAQAPQVGTPDYARQVVEFVRRVAPDSWNGQPVGFFNLFNTTVPVDIAFTGQTPNPDLVTLLNLEIWGLPTSNPAADPGNGGFIYQRFQRGIMHYRAEVPVTEGILVGEYFKSVLTARNLPPDLSADMQGSRYYNQYNPSLVNWIARPGDLQGTNLTGAFEPGTAAVQPGTGQPQPKPAGPTPTPPPAATATPTPDPASTIAIELQLDDELVDPGQKLRVTVIGRSPAGLDWIEWSADDSDDPVLDADHRHDGCDQDTQCAFVWEVNPTKGGLHDIRARGRDTNGVRSEWTVAQLRVRDGPTPTFTPVPTVGPGTPTPTPVTQPSVKIQLDDTSIDLGEEVEITVIASHDKGLDWIQWHGADWDDPALDEHRYDCDNRKDCARTWTIRPTQKGAVDIEADAKDQNGVRAPSQRQELKIK